MRIPNAIYFPIRGVHQGVAADRQPRHTAPAMKNVRPFDVLEERARGGQRPGLVKWGAGTQIGGVEKPVVAVCSVASVI